MYTFLVSKLKQIYLFWIKWNYEMIYSDTSIYRSRMYRFPGSIVQFLWSLNKSYLNYGNKTRINPSSIYRFPVYIGQNF
jgi:hypothetical protein